MAWSHVDVCPAGRTLATSVNACPHGARYTEGVLGAALPCAISLACVVMALYVRTP